MRISVFRKFFPLYLSSMKPKLLGVTTLHVRLVLGLHPHHLILKQCLPLLKQAQNLLYSPSALGHLPPHLHVLKHPMHLLQRLDLVPLPHDLNHDPHHLGVVYEHQTDHQCLVTRQYMHVLVPTVVMERV